MVRLFTPLFLNILSIVYLILVSQVPESRTGNPNGPIYFPMAIGIFMLLCSIVYFIQEWKHRKEEVAEFKKLMAGRTPFLIGSTIVLILIYSFLFERIGFLYSTILFLGGLLFTVNGKKHWLQNILIAVIFSFISWYSFAELLQVSLP
ncbi:tripartite tricarboxylate transporter TctB family protein [Halobacillus sp. A5]|uniref:tripartite tricarboxylate transporter TctB family protein n=1 Tax=Halobacillus sp. A5 TaxID=2880263 RepID=UPI0020A6A7B1|nr:tripartite tricarboxylate transporter TctB family protein [Halobacillus sp. A5]